MRYSPNTIRALVLAIKDFFEHQLGRVSAKAPIGDAIRTASNHWYGLISFLDDSLIELHTNIVERSMRSLALTRKSAFFAGHDDDAGELAILSSPIKTCKPCGIDAQAYIADALNRLVNL